MFKLPSKLTSCFKAPQKRGSKAAGSSQYLNVTCESGGGV